MGRRISWLCAFWQGVVVVFFGTGRRARSLISCSKNRLILSKLHHIFVRRDKFVPILVVGFVENKTVVLQTEINARCLGDTFFPRLPFDAVEP